jgi:hypothetical protein
MRLADLAVCALLVACAPAARAQTQPPDPSNSSCPLIITVAGSTGGLADPAGSFCVVLRDIANNPIPGARIVVDLSGCPDVKICSDVLDPGATVDCTGARFEKITDSSGSACFTLPGGSTGGIGRPASSPCAQIWGELSGAGGLTLLCAVPVATFDLGGRSGVDAGDLAVWLADFFSGTNPDRSNYDGWAGVGAADLSRWLEVFGIGQSGESCATRCP